MPIDEGVNVDLQFLILEVKKQAQASLSLIERGSPQKARQIRSREDYINNLKNTLLNKSYFNIHSATETDQQVNYYKALITIAANLERCGDIFENIVDQMGYVSDRASFDGFDLRRYYRVIYRALDAIYPALTLNDLDLAQKICDYEQEIDDLYDASFRDIRARLRKREAVDDMLTLLFILRYLERVGDSFLNIGEAILDIHVGEKMGIVQFRTLRKALDAQGIDIGAADVEFTPIMNTRSGSRVAQISAGSGDSRRRVFYKEGSKEKIDEEVTGLEVWNQRFPGLTPAVLWQGAHKGHATVLLEYIEGDDLLELLIRSRAGVDEALSMLTDCLARVWQQSRRSRKVKTNVIGQLMERKADVQSIHGQLTEVDPEFDDLLENARQFEKQLQAPFSTLVHGDLNVDNIIFQLQENRLYFVDVHRSHQGDYAQDVAVFLVSNFRVPIFSSDIRTRLNEANRQMFYCARDFAESTGDTTFEARLALGVARSLITSTRFLFDRSFSADMFHRAALVLRELRAAQSEPGEFHLAQEYFLYG